MHKDVMVWNWVFGEIHNHSQTLFWDVADMSSKFPTKLRKCGDKRWGEGCYGMGQRVYVGDCVVCWYLSFMTATWVQALECP